MARAISQTLLQDLLDQSSEEGLIPLLTVAWNDGPHVGTLRIALNDANVTSNGQTFSPGDFAVQLPDEDEADVPLLQIGIQDADATIRTQLRQLDSRYPATATLDLVLMSNPDTIEQTFSGTIRNVKLTLVSLVAAVELFADLSREPVTPYRMSPAYGFHALRSR